MLKYLIIQLDDTSVSFCHYNNGRTEPQLIALDALKDVLFWSMKENLTIQFLYPDYELPSEYKETISRIDHANVVSSLCEDATLRGQADVVVFDTWDGIRFFPFKKEQAYVIRTSFDDLIERGAFLFTILSSVTRVNITITDVAALNTDREHKYSDYLARLAEKVASEYKSGHNLQVNLLTDRILLDVMNNCNAGIESITLAPDGKFYICPGFYLDKALSVGDVKNGPNIKNQHLYRLNHAPICRHCDAWHCRRCIWLNQRTTLEVNTPSREQCVMAHIERNASRNLLAEIRKIGAFLPDKQIPEIDYSDPFDKFFK